MKEIEVSPGDDIETTFTKAWQVFWKLNCKEPVCFHFNDCRVVMMSDDSHSSTQILSDQEAKKLVEMKQ
jgi:hypothetical protein